MKINRQWSKVLGRMEKRAETGNTKGLARSVATACKNTTDAIRKEIAASYLDAYYRQWYELQDADGVYFRPPKMSGSQVNAYLHHKIEGMNWEDRLKGHFRDYVTGVSTMIKAGKNARLNDSQIKDSVKALTGTVGEPGVTYKIERILRTETNAAVNDAALSVFKRAGIEKYFYNSMLDDVSCEICDELDWKSHKQPFLVKNAQTGVNLAPMHPNCRCWADPIISDKFRKMADKKGKKSRHISYATWYRRYVA